MRRFRYRLQRILEIKVRIEERHKVSLGEALTVLNREQDRLGELEVVRGQYQRAARTGPAPRLDVSLLGLSARYLLRLQREIGEQRDQVRKVEALVEDRRRRLVEATREKRVYEILKERAQEAHRREKRRQEGRQLDEVGEQLYLRRRKEESTENA